VLRLSLLGAPLVTVDASPVTFDTRKATALLAVLAVERRPQPRDRLAALLWPDADATRARSALRRTLSVTAAAVGDAIVAGRSVVELDAARSTCDVTEFEDLVRAGDATSLHNAATLYRDDFLAGFSLRDAPEWEDWHERVADAMRRRLAVALGALVDADIAAGDLDTAVGVAERWLALDPMHEPAHHALIRLYAWRGDRSAAMRQYRTCVRVLDEELGVEPLPETTELYDAVRRDSLPPPQVTAAAPALLGKESVAASSADVVVVGRAAELATIRQGISRAADGHGVAAVVLGPTGAGKTTLLRLITEAAAPPRSLTIAVRCHPDEAALAYGVVIELLRGLLTTAPHVVESLPQHVRSELARLLPEVADLDGAATDNDDPAAVARLYAAVRETVVAAAAPCVFVVDDVQWLDSASGDVLAYLVRRVASIRLALVLARSSDGSGASSAIDRAIAEAVDDGAGIQLTLNPLDRDAVGELIKAGDADVEIDVDQLMVDTGGNPALVGAWLDAVRRGEDPLGASATAVHETLSRRLHLVSQTAQQVLAAAAVLSGRLDPDVLRDTSGRGETETVVAVEEALRAGLLVELPGGAGYDIPFEALRRVLIGDTTLARLRLLHQRAAHALIKRVGSGRLTPADAGAIAQHLQAAGHHEDAASWHWRAAVEARALHAHDEALTETRAALDLGFAAAPARLAEGEALIALGRYREAITALERAAAAADSASAGAVLVERRLADVHHRLGDYAVADVHLAAALDQSDGFVPDTDVALMLSERALLAMRQGAVDAAGPMAQSGLDTAQRSADDGAISYSLNVCGVLSVRTGDIDAAERLFRESFESAQRAQSTDGAIAALNNLARLLSTQGRHDEALATGADALHRGEEVGDRHRLAALHANLADLLRATGRHEESMNHLKQAAALFAAVDDEPQRRPEIWKLVEW